MIRATRLDGRSGKVVGRGVGRTSRVFGDHAHQISLPDESDLWCPEMQESRSKCGILGAISLSWARLDSNQRRQSHQIYSLTRLATSVHARPRFGSRNGANNMAQSSATIKGGGKW